MVDSGLVAGRQGASIALVSALRDSGQSLIVGAWVLAGQSTGYNEGGSSDNEPQGQPLCVSVTHKDRWSPSPGDAGLDRREKMGATVCPSPPRSTRLMWARTRQAVGLLAGRQGLPNSQSLPRPPRVPWEWLHPSGHPSKWSPRQQVLTSPWPFHSATVGQAKGQRRAGPDA